MEISKELQDAIDKLTKEQFLSLDSGDEVKLNDTHCLSRYVDEDIVVIVREEEWEEEAQVLIRANEGFDIELL